MAEVSIYALVDPRDGQIRYIGQSRSLEWRYQEHCFRGAANPLVGDWRDELRAAGLIYQLRLLETTTREMADGRERFWIMWALRRKCPLLNKQHMALLRDLLTLEDTLEPASSAE